MDPVVKVEQVAKKFKEKFALKDISFSINKGEIFGFLGPSGSGKTTMIKIITGQLTSDNGEAYLFNKKSSLLSPSDFEKLGIVSDTSGFFEKMSLEKNISIYAKLHGIGNDKVNSILKEVGLKDSKKLIAEKLSTGMKQRMLLARALIHSPQVLFLDEPTSGLDPTTSKQIHELLLRLKASGTTIFLTTHDMHEATLLCDNLVLLNQGYLIEQGSPQDLINKYNTDKKVHLTFENGEEVNLKFEEIKNHDLSKVLTIHSCEPTLEDIFIQRTGVKLNV